MQVIENKNTRNIYVSLNYQCDNHCIMCGVPYKKHDLYNENIDFYINELLSAPFEIRENDIITISGGEPFLFNRLFEFIEYVTEKFHCRIVIFTNGRALKNNTIIEQIKKYSIEKFVIPYFSYKEEIYDYIAGAKGAFQDLEKALYNLEKNDLSYELKFLPMKQNHAQMLDSYIYCKKNYPRAQFVICGVQLFGEAVDNVSWIGMKYSEIKDDIEKTLDYALECYEEVIPVYRYPMCILDSKYNNHGVLSLFLEYIIGPDYSDVDHKKNPPKIIKLPSECEECRSYCEWYPTKYGQIYGFDELKKI